MTKKPYMYVSQWAYKLGEPGPSLYTFDPGTGAISFVKKINDEPSLGCSMVNQEKS